MGPKKKVCQDPCAAMGNVADNGIPDRLICPVCMEVPEKVMLTDDCGHLLCESCTKQILAKDDILCPICQEAFSRDTIRHSRFLQREINALPTECPSEGCDWKKERSELPAHLKRCPLATIPCPHDGCKATMKRKDLAAHEAECPESTVECPNRKVGCKELMKRCEVDRHCRRCEHEMISCANKGCDAKMLRKDADDHQDVCPEAMVRCAHAEDGCKARMKRKNLEEHMEANKFAHLQLQVKSMKDDFTKQIREMKEAHGKETTALKKQCESLEDECETLKEKAESLEEENETLKETTNGERCVVKLPVNADGSATYSNEFKLFGEQWKLLTDEHQGYRTLYLEIVSAAKYAASFSLILLPPTADNTVERRNPTARSFGKCLGWKFIAEDEFKPYLLNGCFYVEVFLREPPSTHKN